MDIVPKKTVLIIEDDLDIRDLFFEIFSSSHFNVLLAENGKVGLDILVSALEKKELPDVILVDMLMPVLNGIEFISIIRKQYPKTLATLPYIITSAKDHDELRAMNLEKNFIAVKKPMDVDELLEKTTAHAENFKCKF